MKSYGLNLFITVAIVSLRDKILLVQLHYEESEPLTYVVLPKQLILYSDLQDIIFLLVSIIPMKSSHKNH